MTEAFDPAPFLDRIGRSPYHVWAGISGVEVRRGTAVLRLALQPHHLNRQGVVHGGVIAGLLDSACGISLRSLLEAGTTHRTVQLNVSFLGTAGTGVLVATGTAVHSGRSIGYAESELRDSDGRLVARATAVFAKLPDPPEVSAGRPFLEGNLEDDEA